MGTAIARYALKMVKCIFGEGKRDQLGHGDYEDWLFITYPRTGIGRFINHPNTTWLLPHHGSDSKYRTHGERAKKDSWVMVLIVRPHPHLAWSNHFANTTWFNSQPVVNVMLAVGYLSTPVLLPFVLHNVHYYLTTKTITM